MIEGKKPKRINEEVHNGMEKCLIRYIECPVCRVILDSFKKQNYCEVCGQKLDWTEGK